MEREEKSKTAEPEDDDGNGTSEFVREVLNTVQESLNVKRIVRDSARNVAPGFATSGRRK